MAEITTTQSFSDGDTVTATKLNNIQANASVQPEAITNRSAETTIDQANDLLLVYDASATALKKVTPSDLIKAGTASNFPITGNATIGGTLGVSGAITASTAVINVGSGQIYKDASGNVGIGTTSAAYKLTVQSDGTGGSVLGAFLNSTVSNDNYAQLYLGKSFSANNCGTISYVPNSTSSLSALRLGLYGSSDTLSINGSGNVGIGTNSPVSALDVNGKISVGDGTDSVIRKRTASTPLYFKSAAGTAEMIIDSSGKVLVGGTTAFGVGAGGITSTVAAGSNLALEKSNGGSIAFYQSGVNTSIIQDAQSQGGLQFYTGTSGSLAERLRIDSSGNLLVGTTSSTVGGGSILGGSGFGLSGAYNNNYGIIQNSTNSTATQYFIGFQRNGSNCGSITSSGANSTSYNTSSDYRLKTNLEPISNGIERVKQLPVYRFNWIADQSGNKLDGFVAHEAQAIVPECVTGEKDAVDADGKPIYQGIDQSKIVPLLTAALKEAIAKIETLEAKVTALEAA
jgi:hypothetical protein